MNEMLSNKTLFIQQKKELMEIVVDFESKNKYQILDENKKSLGWIIEKGKGFMSTLSRLFLRSHRPLNVHVFDDNAGGGISNLLMD